MQYSSSVISDTLSEVISSNLAATKPVLLLDKTGVLGQKLASIISKQTLTVLVAKTQHVIADNIVSVPYRGVVPKIPDNQFSHIFIFFSGERDTLRLLRPIAKKAQTSGAKVIFILPHNLATQRLCADIKEIYTKTQICIVGDVFGASDMTSPVEEMVRLAKRSGKISLLNNGLSERYPIHIADVLTLLLAVGDEQRASTSPFFLAMSSPVTELSVARSLHNIEPTLAIQLRADTVKSSTWGSRLQYEALLPNTYPLAERMKEAFMQLPIHGKTQILQKAKAARHVSIFRGTALLAIMLGACLIAISLLPTLVGYISLTAAEKALQAGRLAEAKSYASVAKESFSFAKTGSEVPLAALETIGLSRYAQQGSIILQIGSALSGILTDGLESVTLLLGMQGNTPQSKTEFIKGLSLAKHAALHLQQIGLDEHLPDAVKQKIVRYREPAGLFTAVTDSLPVLMGFEGEKTYLLLFQNNMELRPGGGFIGSYGVVTVKNGKMGEVSIYDVYDADGQLKGHIDPPFPYRRYMGVNHWFLRDSNYAPSFAENAAFAAYLLDLETKQQVDGVIAVDTHFVQALLRIVGPVYVPDYQETVSADSFYLVTQKHAETGFTPGSTQKKDFLRSLYNAVSLKMASQQISMAPAVWELYTAIQEKHILFASSDSSIQQIFTANGLSAVLPLAVKSPGEFSDVLALVEANVGANKGNYYLTRNIKHDISLSETGNYQSTVTVAYENKSDAKSIFGGVYKTYLRFFVPKELVLAGVVIDEKNQTIVPAITDFAAYSSPTFVPPAGIEILTEEQGTLKSYGMYIAIPQKAQKTVRIKFEATSLFNQALPAFNYRYHLVKQPGTDQDSFSFSFSLPRNFQGIDVFGDAALIQKGIVVASGMLAEDQQFTLRAGRK
jgi:hypothetical protein